MKYVFALSIIMTLSACASTASKSAQNQLAGDTVRKPARSFFASYECFPENNADSKILDSGALRLRIDIASDSYMMKQRVYDMSSRKLNDTIISCQTGARNEDGSEVYCNNTDSGGQTRFPFEVSGKKGFLELNIGVATRLVSDTQKNQNIVIYLGSLVSGKVKETMVCHQVGE